jgi:hypothetical protein
MPLLGLPESWKTARRCAAECLDWPLIIVVAGFVFVTPVPGLTHGALIWTANWLHRTIVDDPAADYADAVERAAIKRETDRRPLATPDLSKPKVRLVTFHDERELPLTSRTFPIWASVPAELKAACKNAADPVRRLQEVLGLPSAPAEKNRVTEIEVAQGDIFRPCASQAGLDARECALDFPKPATDDLQNALTKLEAIAERKDPDTETADGLSNAVGHLKSLMAKYDSLYFVSRQLWTSYQAQPGKPGYPFTGMGWTYDWNRGSKKHFGVSEFVVRPQAAITKIGDTAPADFCR